MEAVSGVWGFLQTAWSAVTKIVQPWKLAQLERALHANEARLGEREKLLASLMTIASVNRDHIQSHVRIRIKSANLMEPSSGPRGPYVLIALVVENLSVYPITITRLTGTAMIHGYDAGSLSGRHEPVQIGAQGAYDLYQEVNVKPGFFAELRALQNYQPGRLDLGMNYTLAFSAPFGPSSKQETLAGYVLAYP